MLSALIASLAHSGTQADEKCIEWMLSQYPEVNKTAYYIKEHDLLIEKLPRKKGPIGIIHTKMGSVASVPFAKIMDCRPKRSVFMDQEVRGVSGFLNEAFKTKTRGLYKSDKEQKESLKFLSEMSLACAETSYPRLAANVKAVCEDLSRISGVSFFQAARTPICRKVFN